MNVATRIRVLIADDSEAMRHAIWLLLASESMFITRELESFTELVATPKSMKPDATKLCEIV
jgi:hypothetical protein